MALARPPGGRARRRGWRRSPNRPPRPEQALPKIQKHLEFLGLGARADEPAATLRHRDQRLLEIAMAVVEEPQLLLLDEPTQGPSAEDTAATLEVIRQIARDRQLTILRVEHDMEVVFDLAHRISVLHFGQLIADGRP